MTNSIWSFNHSTSAPYPSFLFRSYSDPVFEKQIVLRTNRLIRVRNVRCLRSIFWVFRFPGLCTSGSRCRVYAPQ